MKRWLPFPLLSAALLVLWLLLNQTLALGHIVLGVIIAMLAPWALLRLDPPRARIRRPGMILKLTALVISDIVRSNIAVARIILFREKRERTSGFVQIGLSLRDPYGLAALACIITSTPGTLWVSFDSAKGTLLIHVLDLIDENTWIRTIRDRYERRLLEIFE